MRSFFAMHLQGIKVSLSARMAYRWDFFLSMVIMLLIELLSPLITILIYRTGASFPGWTIYEVLLIQGIFLLSKGIAFPLFFGMANNTINLVREGTFDLLMIKPKPILQMAIVTGFDSEDLGKLFGGIALFSFAIVHLPPIGFLAWLQFISLFLVTLVVLFACATILSGLGIIWIGNFRVYEIFDSISLFAMYPGAIFSKTIQVVITIVIPLAMMGSIPATVLLGRLTPFSLYSVITSFIFLFISMAFWNLMLQKYTSAGG